MAPLMVPMITRNNSELSGTESSDPDIRLAYRSIIQHGSLDWLVTSHISHISLQVDPLNITSGSPSHTERSAFLHRFTPNREIWRLIVGDITPQWTPGLKLSAAGSQGLSELKQCISQSEQSVFFVFCRLSVDGDDCFATITYLPEGTSGLRRGAPITRSITGP